MFKSPLWLAATLLLLVQTWPCKANSAPEQASQAKQEVMATLARLKSTTASSITKTVAEQETINFHEMAQAQEAMQPPPPPPLLPGNPNRGGGPYIRTFKQNPNVISIGAVLDSPEGIAQFLHVREIIC